MPKSIESCLLGLVQGLPGVVMALRVDGRLLYMNAAGRSLLGVPASESIAGLRLADFYSSRTYQRVLSHAIPTCLRRGAWSGEIALRDRQRNEILTNQMFMAHHVGENRGDAPVIATLAWDIRPYKATEETLRRQATHDALTDCACRSLLIDRLVQAIHRAERRGRMVGVLFLDLDDFKHLNDTFGHETANEVLREVAQRLRTHLRGEDTVARYGGDEFVLLVPDLTAASDVARVTCLARELLDEPVVVNGVHIPVTASVGVAHYPLDGRDPETLLRAADSAMYRVKRMRNAAAGPWGSLPIPFRSAAARHGGSGAEPGR
ncbi:MAG: sensor domain-containing diguanylate cyclase [Gammaproteobacteria bacterium]